MLEQPLLIAALWLTTADGTALLARSSATVSPDGCAAGAADVTVFLDTGAVKQPVQGFGAALTESAVVALDALPRKSREAALEDLFGPAGLRLSTLRLPIGATDFSKGDYSCEEPRRCLEPLLRDLKAIRAMNPSLEIVGSPWSAPASMKTNGDMSAGWLKPSEYEAYAGYLARFAAASRDSGAPLSYLTPVNEPLKDSGNQNNRYPTMWFSPEEEARFIGEYLGPALSSAGVSEVKVLAFDHNWSSASYALKVLSDPLARAFTAGSAFHCYGGEPEMMAPVYAAFPDKEIHFTECAAGGWSGPFEDAFPWMVKNVVIGNLANGARSVTFWNLALQEDGGPTNFGCLECRGVLTVNRYANAYDREPEYYALGHGSLAVEPGTVRIASRLEPAAPTFSQVALRGPGGGLALIAYNDSPRGVTVRVRAGAACVDYAQPARSAATVRWR